MPQQLALIKSSTEQIWSNPTWDIISIFTLLAVGFFYGISTGKRRLAVTLIYTYVALAIHSALPLPKLGQFLRIEEDFLVKIGSFLAIFFLLIFLLGSRKNRSFAPAVAWWQIFLFSFLQVGLLLHTILNFLPPEKIKILAPVTKQFFANPNLHIWWLLIPIVFMIILRRFGRQD